MGKKKSAKRPETETPKLSFEQALEKLEQIVGRLEDGQLPLSESLAQYERAMRYLRQCYDQLERAERKIELLTGMDSDGRGRSQPFDEGATSLEQKQQTRSRRRSRPAEPDRGDPPSAEPPSLF